MLTSMVAHTVGQIQEDSCELSTKARAMTAGSHSGKGELKKDVIRTVIQFHGIFAKI